MISFFLLVSFFVRYFLLYGDFFIQNYEVYSFKLFIYYKVEVCYFLLFFEEIVVIQEDYVIFLFLMLFN